MTKVFEVKSNLKLDGNTYEKGQFILGDFPGCEQLALDGVIREIAGAENADEAKRILETEKTEAGEQESEKVMEPENTWGPKKDEEVKPEDTKTAENIELYKHVVTEEDIANNPDVGLVLGEEIELPVDVNATPEDVAKAVAEYEKQKAEEDTVKKEGSFLGRIFGGDTTKEEDTGANL